MNLLGMAALVYVPDFVRAKGLRTLLEMTATAFGSEIPSQEGLTCDERLSQYARFTVHEVEKAIDRQFNLGTVRHQLCQSAFELGKNIRSFLGISSKKDVMRAGKAIYKCLGISFHGSSTGDITINRCYFSSYYSDQVCGIVSCLDKGLMAGLSEGGRLNFSQRITEGADCCKAVLEPRETSGEKGYRRGEWCWWCNCC